MTSKHLFFRAMREDLRHKIWMVALSVLGSFLALPVAWLFMESNMPVFLVNQEDGFAWLPVQVTGVIDFFVEDLGILGGIQTIGGALITGLFGFCYLFHKNRMDTYHSLPIKRRTLFGACYVNGILIWFLPFFLFLLLTLLKASAFLHKVGGDGLMATLWKEAALTFLVLVIVYLLVYNLVLTAVMLSGNMLNALVNMMILGFVIISIYGIGYGFFQWYMDFFYDARDWEAIIYASPLFSAPCLIFWRAEIAYGSESCGELLGKMSINLLLAAALGWCAWLLYRKRASELSEQGTKNPLAVLWMKLIVSVGAGMCGWKFFSTAFANSRAVGWGIFGVLFGTVLVFGVLDIIFHMEFKAFFAHKLQMGLAVVFALLICFTFRWDWLGYDQYLPPKDQIESIAVCGSNLGNRYISPDSEGYPLENMSIQDADAIYAYLERMTSGEDTVRTGGNWNSARVLTKVTLKNGRTYYRSYRAYGSDREVVWPLLTSQEYMKYAYVVSDEMIRNIIRIYLVRGDGRVEFNHFDPDTFALIAQAYNQDILEDPECALVGRGRLLARIDCTTTDSEGVSKRVSMSVYETMERTLEALRQAGLGEWAAAEEASNVQAVRLTAYQYDQPVSAEDMIEMARETYGVYGQTKESDVQEEAEEEAEVQDREVVSSESAQTMNMSGEDWEAVLMITDRAEVEELLSFIDYATPYFNNVFGNGCVTVSYFNMEGEEKTCYIPMGTLPEKYILRFGELVK